MEGQLSFWDCRHIEEILDDPVLTNLIIVGGIEKGRRVTISPKGVVKIGRTKYDWINRIFEDYKSYSFTDFALNAANALAGQSANRNNALFHSISTIVLEQAIADKNYRYVVDALYDVFRHGWNGEHRSKFFAGVDSKAPNTIRCDSVSHNVQQQHVYVGEVRTSSGEIILDDITIKIPTYSRR